MIIRCNKCYKVLHTQEVYCTRCGERSETVVEYMKNPTNLYLTNFSHMKIGLSLYFFICFLLNGLLSVMLGVYYYQVIDQTIDFGTIGTNIPIEVLSFSQSYSLLIIGISASIIYTFYNRKQVIEDIVQSMKAIKNKPSKVLISLLLLAIGMILIWYGASPLGMNGIIPPSLITYLSLGRISIWIILPILILFAYLEELVFRKMMIEGLDERFLFGDGFTFLIMTVTYSFYHLLVFLDFTMIIPTLLLGILMAIVYRLNKDRFFIGFLIRVMMVIIFLFISL